MLVKLKSILFSDTIYLYYLSRRLSIGGASIRHQKINPLRINPAISDYIHLIAMNFG